jgi:hypothetical protein
MHEYNEVLWCGSRGINTQTVLASVYLIPFRLMQILLWHVPIILFLGDGFIFVHVLFF